MQKKRFNLPPLDLIQGFEAAARNLSFTKAAEELFITQSAVSRQIRGAGGAPGHRPVRAPASRAGADRAGPRALRGRRPSCWSGCRSVTDRLRADGATPAPDRDDHQRLCLAVADPAPARASPPLHPDVDVRISASYKLVNSGAQPGRRGGALLPGRRRRRRAPSGCSARSCFRSAARRCSTEGPHPLRTLQDLRAPRAAAHGRGRRLSRLGHVAGGAGLRRSQARGLAAGSTATSR